MALDRGQSTAVDRRVRRVFSSRLSSIGLYTACLMASAMAVALCRTSSANAWLGFLALMPFFASMATLRAGHALVAGALWGGFLYVGMALLGGGVLPPGPAAPLLMVGVPALYMFAGAWLTRRIGFSPFVVGAGWLLVELAFLPLGLHDGLLAVSQFDGWFIPAAAHGLGYVFVAFVSAYVNALLVSSVAMIVSVPGARRYLTRPCRANFGKRIVASLSHVRSAFLPSLAPRAPPRIVALSSNMTVS